jgi:mannose PTS system EIIA component
MPLATALEACVQHVLGAKPEINCFDVQPDECPQEATSRLVDAILADKKATPVLILTDLPGATPSNIAVAASVRVRALGVDCKVLGGVNASMLLKSINYRTAALDVVTEKALVGATQAVLRVD